jgi:hypothetical protein
VFLHYTQTTLHIVCYIQGVWMKGIQNKKCIYQKLIVIHVSGLYHRKGKLRTFSFMPGLCAGASWWPLASSVTMSTAQEQVQCVFGLAELQSLTSVQCHFRTQYGRQPPTHKSIQFWDKKLRTIGSLLHVKSPEKTQTSEENVSRIREHSCEVPANQFMLLACSYKFHCQQCMMCYTKGSA